MKVKDWIALKPKDYFGPGKDWAAIRADGRVAFYLGALRTDGYIEMHPETLIPFAKWLIETFDE